MGKSQPDLFFRVTGIDISGDDKENIIGRIPSPVVTQDIICLQPIENVRVANDRVAVGTFGIGDFEETAAGAASWIILAHVHFPTDNIQLLSQLIGGKGRVLHDIAQNLDRDFPPGVGHVNPINRSIKGGISVHVTARILHFLIDPACTARGGPFEEHVLEHVRKSRSQPIPLVNASRFAPGLRRDDRRRMILSHDNRQAIVQSNKPHARRLRRNFWINLRGNKSRNGSGHGFHERS